MPTYYVDDGGDNSNGDSWAHAYTSVKALDDAVALASGDVVYVGHNHVCPQPWSAAATIVGPTSGLTVKFISATQGSDPPTYAKSATDQIDTSNGAYSLTFDGSFSFYGIRAKSGGAITFSPDTNEACYGFEMTLAPSANSYVQFPLATTSGRFDAPTIDLTADGTTARGNQVAGFGASEIRGLAFVNAAYRTGTVGGKAAESAFVLSGADFSGFTNGTLCQLLTGAYLQGLCCQLANCKTAATWAPVDGAITVAGGSILLTDCGPAESPTYLYFQNYFGTVASSIAIYRTGGQSIGAVPVSWLLTTEATAGEATPLATPWIYGSAASSGSKTFDVFITNDTADFTDAEVWLEVEYLSDATAGTWTLASDHRATILTTAAAQTDDTDSTWNGTGPSFTYKQKLSKAATLGQAGLYRARVCCAVASVAGSRYFYVDPLVTVS